MSLGFRLRLFSVATLSLLIPFLTLDALGARGILRLDTWAIPFGIVSAIGAAGTLTFLSSRWLARELHRITDAARRMASGDLAIRLRIHGDDQIAALGHALDRLGESLSGAMDDLRGERDLIAGILDGMQEGVLLIKNDGRIGLVNPSLREMFLLRANAVNRHVIDVIRHSALMEMLDRARTTKIAKTQEIELGGLKPRRLLVRAAPLANEDGSILVVFVDVTDLRRLELVRRDFVANVSHELRTPVTAIQSAAETLQSGALSDPVAAKKFLEMIERNTERLRSLIDDLLELSRIEAKAFKLRRESVHLAPVLAHVLAGVHTRAERQRVTLATEIDDDARTAVVDRRALEQVLANLVENAIKYCPGAQVTVAVKRRAGGGVVIAVADTGPGIEDRHLPRVFERFYRIDPGRAREAGGTGLGLSIVKHLCEALGGTITVASQVGRGTTFTVELPQVEDSSPRLPE